MSKLSVSLSLLDWRSLVNQLYRLISTLYILILNISQFPFFINEIWWVFFQCYLSVMNHWVSFSLSWLYNLLILKFDLKNLDSNNLLIVLLTSYLTYIPSCCFLDMTVYFLGPYKLRALILHENKINEIDFILSLLDLWLFLDLNSYIGFLGCVYECFQLFLTGIIMGETGSHMILKEFVFHAVHWFFFFPIY